jgi:hypothetical protein
MCVQQHVSVGMLKREENQNNIHGLPFFAILHVKTGNVFFFLSRRKLNSIQAQGLIANFCHTSLKCTQKKSADKLSPVSGHEFSLSLYPGIRKKKHS